MESVATGICYIDLLSYKYMYLHIWGNYIPVICCGLVAFNQTNKRWYEPFFYSAVELITLFFKILQLIKWAKAFWDIHFLEDYF